jgi:hypothetical protein
MRHTRHDAKTAPALGLRRWTDKRTQRKTTRPRQMHVSAISITGGVRQHDAVVEQFQQQQLCDVELRVDGSSVQAHRCILAAVSGYFRAAFAGSGSRMASGGPHDLIDMGVSARHAITFLYEGACTLNSNDELVPLLHAAKRLDMPGLFDAVAGTIGRHLTADSCVGAWALGVDLDAPALVAAARAQCEKEFETLAHKDIGGLTHAAMAALIKSPTLVVADEETVFRALEVWWKAQQVLPKVPPTPEAVAELVQSIRFPHMDDGYILQHVLRASVMQCPAATDALVAVMLTARHGGGTKEWTVHDFAASVEQKLFSPVFQSGSSNRKW